METCNLCRREIKVGEKAVYKEDYHHKECWNEFEKELKKAFDKIK